MSGTFSFDEMAEVFARAEKAEARVAELEAAVEDLVISAYVWQKPGVLVNLVTCDCGAVAYVEAPGKPSKGDLVHLDRCPLFKRVPSVSTVEEEGSGIPGDSDAIATVGRNTSSCYTTEASPKDHLECAGCGVWCPGAEKPPKWTDDGGRHFCFECSVKRHRMTEDLLLAGEGFAERAFAAAAKLRLTEDAAVAFASGPDASGGEEYGGQEPDTKSCVGCSLPLVAGGMCAKCVNGAIEKDRGTRVKDPFGFHCLMCEATLTSGNADFCTTKCLWAYQKITNG